jgi:hypothetical protein
LMAVPDPDGEQQSSGPGSHLTTHQTKERSNRSFEAGGGAV